MHGAAWWWETQVCRALGNASQANMTSLTTMSKSRYPKVPRLFLSAVLQIGPIFQTSVGTRRPGCLYHNRQYQSSDRQWPLHWGCRAPPTVTCTTKARKRTAQSKILRHQSQNVVHQAPHDIIDSQVIPSEDGIIIDSSDGHPRLSCPILCTWIANQEEHISLYNIQSHACPQCDIFREDLGNPMEYPPRNHQIYQSKIEKYHKQPNYTALSPFLWTELEKLFKLLSGLSRGFSYTIWKHLIFCTTFI